MKNRLPSILKLKEKKKANEPIVFLTAYDAIQANLLEEVHVDGILVGDSLGNVALGFKNTLPVTMEHMIHHTKAVSRSVHSTLIIGDMPFMSYHTDASNTKKNAGLFVQEAGAHCVKLEITPEMIQSVSDILSIGIPVIAHIGFTPQRVYKIGGYYKQGNDLETKSDLLKLAVRLEEMGCSALIVEMLNPDLTKQLTEQLSIPVIGIGSGIHCDGVVFVSHDILGLTKLSPSFITPYFNGFEEMKKALSLFIKDIKERKHDQSSKK